MRIRRQTASDLPAICSLLQQAFESPGEADLVVQLIVEGFDRVALVAEAEGLVVGHVLFSEVKVKTEAGLIPALALAPVAVLPSHQRQGIGTTLIQEGLTQCRDSSSSLVFVVGDPSFYERFGFTRERAVKFVCPYAGEYFMAVELPTRDDPPNAGEVIYSPPFAGLPSTE